MANLAKAAEGGSTMLRRSGSPVQTIFDTFLEPFDSFPELAAARRMMSALMRQTPDGGAFVPNVEVSEKDGNYVVSVALPGFKKEDIDIEVAGNELRISGKYERRETDEKTRYTEMRQASFARTIVLPQEIDANKINARFEDGIVRITAPPVTPISARKVTVK